MEEALDIRVSIPPADMRFFKELVSKMGWHTETREDILRKHIASRPKKVKLSDKDIVAEVSATRKKRVDPLVSCLLNSPLVGSGIDLENIRSVHPERRDVVL